MAEGRGISRWRPVRNPSGAIYGTIVASAILAGEGVAHLNTQDIVTSVLVTLLVYWIAHAYSEVLGQWMTASTSPSRPSTLPRLGQALAEDWSIVAGGFGLVLVLAVVRLAGVSGQGAVATALWFAIAQLLVWGIVAAKGAGLVGIRMAISGAVSASFGVAIVVLEAALH